MLQELIMAQNYRQHPLQFSGQMPKLSRNKNHHQVIRLGLTPISKTQALLQKSTFIRSQHRGRINSVDKKRLDFSGCDLSVEQIKSKIKQFLSNNSHISAVNFGSEDYQELPQTKDHFRMTLFKNNQKKRIQLKMLEDLQERGDVVHHQFSISETCISRKKPISPQYQHAFSGKKDRINLINRPKPQNISFTIKLTDMRRRSFVQRQKCSLPKDQSHLGEIQLSVQPWKGIQQGQIQDLPHWSQRE